MSMDWPQDIQNMQTKYGTRKWVEENKDCLLYTSPSPRD